MLIFPHVLSSCGFYYLLLYTYTFISYRPYIEGSLTLQPVVKSHQWWDQTDVIQKVLCSDSFTLSGPCFGEPTHASINKVDFHSRAIYGERIKLIVVHDTPNNMTVVASTKLCYVMSLERFTLFIYLGALTVSHTPCLLLHIPHAHFRCFLIFLTSSISPFFIPYSFLSFQ